MKGLKKIFSILLCAALILSSAPVLNITLFGTDVKAATYSKQHTKEYYYAPGTQFIAYLATGGDRDGNTARSIVTDSGYTLIDKNLNAGVSVSSGLFSSRDADEVYLGYKTSTDPSVSIRDIRIMINKGSDYYTSPENGFAYTLVGLTPISLNDNDGGGSVDLNQSKSSADYLHYFGTKDVKAGGPIVSVTIDNNSDLSGYESVKYLNSGEFNNVADANRDAGGEYIYTHVTRLPEVDTTALREAMSTADTYLANSKLYVSMDALTKAKDNAKAIIDSYDSYAAGYEAFSTEYNQAAINNAKTAIDNAVSALLTKLDWTNYNAAVSKANGLSKNDYVDFSAVEKALENAELIKNSFTKQEQVDNETAKINSAINSLVKKTTAKSFVQGNAEGHDSGWTFQSCVTLEIYNVNSGTNCDYWNSGAGVDNNVGEEYEKTAQYTSDKWNASKATVYVDPDVSSDIRSTGIYITLTMPWVHSELNKARWGVELAEYQDNYTMGKLQNDMRTVTVQSANGKSLTYALCDENGNDKASAQTCNGDFTLDETISDGKKGPYTWYIKGAVPAAGDKATVRVLGICAAWAHSGNVQKLTEFTDLTIVSVSKTALKKAIYTVVGKESIYTSSSYSAYTAALNEAKTVLNNPTAEQSEVDAATTKLNNAINALQATFDMTKLYAARDKANSLNGSDYVDFSEVANLVNMISETVFNSQQEVDDYADRIEYAISRLVRKGFSATGSVVSQHESEHHNDANVQGRLTAKGASFVSESIYTFFSGYNSESSTETFYASYSNGSGDDLHRAFQSDTDGKAIAYYVFDRYSNNANNVSSLGNILSVYMHGTAKSHQHSVALYDSSYNQSSILIYDTTHTSTTAVGSKSGKSYSYTLKNSGIYCNWEETTFKTTQKDDLSFEGAVPDVGDTVTLRAVYRNGVRGLQNVTGYLCYGWMTFNFITVDSTELRNAIALSNNVLDKSKYSEESYNAYRTALSAATDTLNSDSVPSQSDYDAKATALVNAVNNLERVQAVTLDSQSATTAGTTSVVATIGKAMPSITLPTREHYSFMGYFTQPDGKGVQYYNADGSSARDFDLESDVTLYASWSIDKFNVKFVNYDGTVLRSGDVAYGTKPTYDGDDPIRSADDDTEYTFSGWSPEITEVTADATYTAQFTANEHNYSCVKIDENSHQYVCADCGYKKAAEAHFLVYSANDKKTHTQMCVDCGYETEKEAHHFETRDDGERYVSTCAECEYVTLAPKYNVTLPSGCKITYSIKPEVTAEYAVATIVAPMQKGSDYFVYWVDGEGNIVGTYRTYSFFVTGECEFEPIYAPRSQYTAEREKATAVSRVIGGRYDKEYRTYTIYTEHSVSTTVGSITGHGVIYTTNSAYANSLTTDNDNVTKKAALSSETTLTGLLAVSDNFNIGDTVWARSYIIDGNGNVKYGDVKVLTVTADNGTSEIGTLGCESFDLTAVNVEGDTPTDPTDDTPTEQSPLEKLMSILSKLVDFIKKILEFFRISEVIK